MRRFNSRQLRSIKLDDFNHETKTIGKRRDPLASFRVLRTSYKVLIITFVAVLVLIILIRPLSTVIPLSSADTRLSTSVGNRLIYSCPVGLQSVASNDNEATGLIADFYNKTNGDRNGKANRTIEELTNTRYDGWSLTFNENKKKNYEWKVEQFSNLRTGDIIYESACGEGFNLAMTLQIIKETTKIDHLTVYGNDYIKKSVDVAYDVLEKLAPSGTKIGSLCQGDSTHLYFIPPDSFDLAYTGYIDQLVDPYDIFNTTKNPDTGDAIEDLCKAKYDKSDWAKAKLVDLDQRAQGDWFAKWVSELVRIVKPGKSVLIENVVMPLCDDLNDWGGVKREWWRSAVSKYKWDVDIDSVSTWGDKMRYNVSMRKNTRVV